MNEFDIYDIPEGLLIPIVASFGIVGNLGRKHLKTMNQKLRNHEVQKCFYVIAVFEGFRFSFYLYSEEQQSRIEGHVQVRIEKYFIIIFIGGLYLFVVFMTI